MPDRLDIHQHITDKIVASLENAGDWQRPWKGFGGLPTNALTKKHYNGVNILALWAAQQHAGFSSPEFATYRQWSELDAQVRKGSKATFVVFYKELEVEPEGDDDTGKRMFARATPVFNADQVDGHTREPEIIPPIATRMQTAEDFVIATGAIIEPGKPCYIPSRDVIQMPTLGAFVGTPTSTPTEAYYGVLFHELTHWSGPAHRLDRDLKGRFGSENYAMEELVAELGSAFLSAQHGLANEPRADHAQYLANWLKVLKNDKKAIFSAASLASKATTYLTALGTPAPGRPEPAGADAQPHPEPA